MCTNHTDPQTTTCSIHGQPMKTHHLAHPIPFPQCNLCPLHENNTCLHLLSICTNVAFNNIQKSIYNKAVWQIHKLLLSHSSTKDTLLMTACIHLGNPPTKTIPTWLYPCICTTQCLARLKHGIFIITATPERNKHTTPPKTRAYTSLNSQFAKIMTPLLPPD